MSAKRDEMATQPPQSLPSFAQAFNSPSLSRLPASNNALPPIHRLASPHASARHSPSARVSPPRGDESRQNNRKRLHIESLPGDGHDGDSESDGHRSPRTVRIKEETDHDALPSTSFEVRPAPLSQDTQEETSTPAPSDARPSPSKRRRVTISGISHPINTDVKNNASDSVNNVSPVVMGLTIMRDDPAALEQVRSMLTIKQKQKELIEQRRGSTASILSTAPPTVNVVNAPPPSDDRQMSLKGPPPGRVGGRSPNLPPSSSDRRRSIATASSAAPPNNPGSSHTRHPSPSTLIGATQQPLPHPSAPSDPPTFVHIPNTSVAPHALPAPPISFAHRRAGRQFGGAKGKPADIVISPRGPQSENLQPVIQSAPPIPRAEHQGPSGRYPGMALPSLPQLGGPVHRYTASRVPPTPTRLGMPRSAAAGQMAQPSISGRVAHSPSNASIPIATTLVPPTPATLHNPGYSGEKSAFLAPFEMFYDALADSKQLKSWLGEQLQKSHSLTLSLQRQQEHMEEIVNAAVERRVAAMREDIHLLHRKVEELEQALHRAHAPNQSYSPSTGSIKGKGKANGIPPVPTAPETYTFPPVDPHLRRPEPIRRMPSPTELESRSFPNSQTASPVSFDIGRRLSVSAIRHDPRSPVGAAAEGMPPARKPFNVRERELQGPGYHPPSAAHASRDNRSPKAGLHSSSRSHLHPSEDAAAARRAPMQRGSQEGFQYREGKGSPASSDGRPEGALAPPPPRRETAYVSPSGSHARSPMDDG